jgi:hypothetical protein
MALNSFGKAISVTGPANGFVGSVTRMGDRGIMSKLVSPTASPTAGIPFGAGIVELSNSLGGYFLSFADFLATPGNAQLLQQQFAGICVRNVKTDFNYLSLTQSSGTLQINTTATQATIGSTSIVIPANPAVVMGMAIDGAGLQAGTLVTGITGGGTTIAISLPTIGAMNATPVAFTQTIPGGQLGFYSVGQMCDDLIDGSINVLITNGTPQANLGVYVRAIANPNLPGTFVGDFEAADDVATAALTVTTTLGSPNITTSAGTGLAVGQRISAAGIPPNTYLVSGGPTAWVMSQPATATAAAEPSSFSNMILLGDLANPWLRFRTGNLDQFNIAEVTVLVRHAS